MLKRFKGICILAGTRAGGLHSLHLQPDFQHISTDLDGLENLHNVNVEDEWLLAWLLPLLTQSDASVQQMMMFAALQPVLRLWGR